MKRLMLPTLSLLAAWAFGTGKAVAVEIELLPAKAAKADAGTTVAGIYKTNAGLEIAKADDENDTFGAAASALASSSTQGITSVSASSSVTCCFPYPVLTSANAQAQVFVSFMVVGTTSPLVEVDFNIRGSVSTNIHRPGEYPNNAALVFAVFSGDYPSIFGTQVTYTEQYFKDGETKDWLFQPKLVPYQHYWFQLSTLAVATYGQIPRSSFSVNTRAGVFVDAHEIPVPSSFAGATGAQVLTPVSLVFSEGVDNAPFAPVPEPSAPALFALGLACLAGLRRR